MQALLAQEVELDHLRHYRHPGQSGGADSVIVGESKVPCMVAAGHR
jgi:hypothetical protein